MVAPLLLGSQVSEVNIMACSSIAAKLGAKTFQFFPKNSQRYAAPFLSSFAKHNFCVGVKKNNISPVISHGTFLINLASSNSATVEKSVTGLRAELRLCRDLSIPFLVLHPGSHTGQGISQGVKQIAKNLSKVLGDWSLSGPMILLENMAGQGSQIGGNFEELGEIIELTRPNHRLGVCLDTCHAHSAGYELSSSATWDEMMDKFDRTIGLRRLKVLHVNDSATKAGSRIDRHAKLGEGSIHISVFQRMALDPRVRGLPMILETPPGNHKEEIEMLTRFGEGKTE